MGLDYQSQVLENSRPLATRVDNVTTAGVTYVGKAAPGTVTSSALWQVQKVDESGTPETTVITFADGNSKFDNVWDDRATLTYS